MKERKLNNKGFSLVELIIVIAIMVILVVVIAPQYLKFVNNSRVSADVQTAQAIATATDAAIAEGKEVFGASGFDITKVDGIGTSLKVSKFGSDYEFVVEGTNQTGTSKIILKKDDTHKWECYPNPESTGDPKGINLVGDGLKK